MNTNHAPGVTLTGPWWSTYRQVHRNGDYVGAVRMFSDGWRWAPMWNDHPPTVNRAQAVNALLASDYRARRA